MSGIAALRQRPVTLSQRVYASMSRSSRANAMPHVMQMVSLVFAVIFLWRETVKKTMACARADKPSEALAVKPIWLRINAMG